MGFELRINLRFYSFFQSKIRMQNSDQQPKRTESEPNEWQQAGNNLNLPSLRSPSPQIQIVISRKRPEVIQLDSFDEDERVKVSNGTDRKTTKDAPEKSKKIKKFTSKCQLCKQQGKKIEMKACIYCKRLFHLICLGCDETPIPKKYTCEKCKFQRQEQAKALKKNKKLDPKQLELERVMARKIDKERRKQEQNKKIEEFLQRYPFYENDGRVKFPIEDRLLLVYKDLFEVNETNRVYPVQHPIIPSKILGDLMQIENFFSTFNEELQQEDNEIDARKTMLYFLLNINGPDRNFKLMLGCLLRVYMKDVLNRNKTDNVKVLNDNCFFTILTSLNQNQELDSNFISKVAPEIIRFLATIPSMRKSFEDFQYPQQLHLESKIYLLLSLIKGLSEVDGFHELVSKRSDKIQEMTKQRGDLVIKLKKDQADVLSNKETMREISEAENDRLQKKLTDQSDPSAIAKKDKQGDKNKKKLVKMNTQKEKSEHVIKEFRSRIQNISKSIFFITSEVLFLGLDRNKSEFFFFLRQPNRLYVKFREYLLAEDTQYLIFESREKITELAKSLNQKGIQEKHLLDNLNLLLKEGIIHNQSIEGQGNDCAADLFNDEKQNFKDQVTIEGIIQEILEIEEIFSTYLLTKNLQWNGEEQRVTFTERVRNTFDIQDLKQELRGLQEHFLFVETIQQPIAQQERSQNQGEKESNNEQAEDRQVTSFYKKKVAIRIWGINSEKIKKCWAEYLELCIDASGLWICVHIFKESVAKYVKRKVQYEMEIKKKNEKIVKQKERQKARQIEQEREFERYEREQDREREANRERDNYRERSRSRSRDNRDKNRHRNHRVMDISSSENESHINIRKSTRLRTKKLTIDSDYEEPIPQMEQSNSEELCQVCGEYGDMICCDSCPKVFHLDCVTIKDVPQGQWNCFHCLQKLASERQTRSRTKRLSKN